MSHQVFMTYQFGLKSERAFRDLEAFYDPETKIRKWIFWATRKTNFFLEFFFFKNKIQLKKNIFSE